MSEFFFDNTSCERFIETTDEPERLTGQPTVGNDEAKEVFGRTTCPYCEARLDEITWDGGSGGQIIDNHEVSSHVCNNCGFWVHFRFAASAGQLSQWLLMARMQTFNIQDKDAPLRAVHQWLRHHPDVGHRVHHRKLEFIVRDILRDYFDCAFALTTQTRDGGIDLYSFDTERGKLVVEVKGFGPGHKVGVGIVRALAGVLVRENTWRGLIVTTSGFTRDAQKEASVFGKPSQRYPMDIDLKSLHELIASLKVGNTRSLYSGSMEYWASIIRPMAGDAFTSWADKPGQLKN